MIKTMKNEPVIKILGGVLMLAILSQVLIPMEVPITLQSLGISLIAILFTPWQSLSIVGLYLGLATLGLPVLAGGLSNPLWFMNKTGGYLFSFLPAVFLMSTFLEKERALFLKSWVVFFTGTLLVLILGTIWLTFFVGLEKAVMIGFLPFIWGSFIKITIAACIDKGWKR